MTPEAFKTRLGTAAYTYITYGHPPLEWSNQAFAIWIVESHKKLAVDIIETLLMELSDLYAQVTEDASGCEDTSDNDA